MNNQQQPVLSFLDGFLVSWVVLPPPEGCPLCGCGPGLLITFDFISFDNVVNAFSTLTASFADVSKNLIPRESAKVFPSYVFTCLLA